MAIKTDRVTSNRKKSIAWKQRSLTLERCPECNTRLAANGDCPACLDPRTHATVDEQFYLNKLSENPHWSDSTSLDWGN